MYLQKSEDPKPTQPIDNLSPKTKEFAIKFYNMLCSTKNILNEVQDKTLNDITFKVG